jgi:hypothetical protein
MSAPATRATSRRVRRALWGLAPIALALLALAFALRGGDLAHATAALRGADWRLVAIAALINVPLIAAARTGRFAALLRALPTDGPKLAFLELSALLLATRAVSLALPGGRAGDLLRATVLRRQHGYPWEAVAASHLAEPAIEALSLGLPSLALLALARPPPALAAGLFTMSAIGLCSAGLGLFLARSRARPCDDGGGAGRFGRPRWLIRRAWATIRHGMRLLEDPWTWAISLTSSLVADALDVAMVALCAAAVGIPLSLAGAVMVLIAVNVALVLPALPGNVGLVEAGAVLALTQLGTSAPLALAFAALYHLAHLLPVAIAGGLCLTGIRSGARREVPTD